MCVVAFFKYLLNDNICGLFKLNLFGLNFDKNCKEFSISETQANCANEKIFRSGF